MRQKDEAVVALTKGVQSLFKKNKVATLFGHGRLVDAHQIEVSNNDGTFQKLSAENIVIASGSKSTGFPGALLDEKKIVSSTGALSLPSVPKELLVIGGGIIGLELVPFG